jgi:hypothetical protein
MRRLLFPLALTPFLLLAGCGGGVWLGVCDGCDGGDGVDDPPSVALVASPAQARSGDTVRLAAAASDDFAVREVEFYRLDALGNATRLDTDTTSPYELDTTIPGGSGGATVRYFARATDDRRQRTDSAEVAVSVLP